MIRLVVVMRMRQRILLSVDQSVCPGLQSAQEKSFKLQWLILSSEVIYLLSSLNWSWRGSQVQSQKGDPIKTWQAI